ncbi:uncharacterized protein METZ01_LOCUS107438, partial [marine metagenome]
VAAAGIRLLSDALRDQGVQVVDALWEPPSEVVGASLAQVAADLRRLAANERAVQAMIEAKPAVVGVTTAAETLGLEPRQFL